MKSLETVGGLLQAFSVFLILGAAGAADLHRMNLPLLFLCLTGGLFGLLGGSYLVYAARHTHTGQPRPAPRVPERPLPPAAFGKHPAHKRAA